MQNQQDNNPDNPFDRDRTNETDDKPMDLSNSDAAADNAREQERIDRMQRSSDGDRLIDPESAQRADDEDLTGEDADRKVRMDDDAPELEALSDAERENLAGSTNLSLDELKNGENPTGLDPVQDDDKYPNP